jgi:serine/threonine protein kinase
MNDYIILHPAIGKGSFGSVYKAIHRSTNIMRAVKRVLKRGKKFQ